MGLVRRGRGGARRGAHRRRPGLHRSAGADRRGDAGSRHVDGHAHDALERDEPGSAARSGTGAGGGGGHRRARARAAGSTRRAGGHQSESRTARTAVVTAPGPRRPSVRRGSVGGTLAAVPRAPGTRFSARPGGRWSRAAVGGDRGPRGRRVLLRTPRCSRQSERRSVLWRRRCVAWTSPTSSATGASRAGTRCSRRCASPTGRCSCTTSSGCPRRRTWWCCRPVRRAATPHRPARRSSGSTASLLATGLRAVIAATVAVPDATSTVDFMAELHRGLADGTGPAEALRRARQADPIIGGAFACHGAD